MPPDNDDDDLCDDNDDDDGHDDDNLTEKTHMLNRQRFTARSHTIEKN